MVNAQQLIDLLRREAIENDNPYWIKKLKNTPPSQFHIAIMAEPYLSLVLDGRKTVESRFSKRKVAPWKTVAPGDVIVLKKSGGDFVAVFEAEDVIFKEVNDNIDLIKQSYNDKLCIEDRFWESKSNSNYATLISISNLFPFRGFHLTFKNRQPWIDLGTI